MCNAGAINKCTGSFCSWNIVNVPAFHIMWFLFLFILSRSSAHELTGRELQPRADLVDGGGAAEAEEAQAEHAGPHRPQGDAHQHRHRLEGGQRGQAGQAAPAVRDGPV